MEQTKTTLSRRRFGALSAASAACLATRPLWSQAAARAVQSQPSAYDLVAAQDHDRILRLAAHWLPARPDTITAHPSPRSPGGPHDFFSEADYFWPNPAHPSGPYKEIDGRSNPDNFLEHRVAMIRLSQAVPALAAAYLLTGRKDYARAAIAHLLAWFVTPATRMNPSLDYAQGVRNGAKGRSYGIIDTLHLVEVARSVEALLPVLTARQYTDIQLWFSAYIEWLRSSDPGVMERDATNNHGIAWALQVAEFARLTANEAERDKVRERFKHIQLPGQMAADGSFPRELARTKPYGYSIFNFDIAAALCWSLTDDAAPENKPPDFNPAAMHKLKAVDPAAADKARGELIRYTLPDGRGMCRAAEFIFPFLEDKTRWPYKQDTEHWESWPVRSPGLLFCGLACSRPDYIALWRRLDPDPAYPEIVRNFPVRQPLLWV